MTKPSKEKRVRRVIMLHKPKMSYECNDDHLIYTVYLLLKVLYLAFILPEDPINVLSCSFCQPCYFVIIVKITIRFLGLKQNVLVTEFPYIDFNSLQRKIRLLNNLQRVL